VSWLKGKTESATQISARPPAAVELAPEGVLAAALPGKGAPPVMAFEPLPDGTLQPGISAPNLASPDLVAKAVRKALDQVEPRRRAITVIVPDSAVRVFVLDFDSLPAKPAEVIPVLRFRLRKMAPFDVEQAGVSYQVLSHTANETRVLTAMIPGPVLAEYETAIWSAGYEPGSVLSTSLAALASVNTDEPVLAACMNAGSLTTVIAHRQDLLLFRTLELPDNPAQRLAEVQRDIAVASAYFEDKLNQRPQTLHYAGRGTAGEFSRWIQERELNVVDLAPQPATGAATALGSASLAGIAGALAGVV